MRGRGYGVQNEVFRDLTVCLLSHLRFTSAASASLRLCVFQFRLSSSVLPWCVGAAQGGAMEIVPCRECGAPVKVEDPTCLECGALQPGRAQIEAMGYVWESEGQWMGFPLVHIAFGHDDLGHARTAKGIIAIGQRAVGGVAIGIVAGGFVSIGIVSMGVFSLGVASVGALLAVGVNAFGAMAIGVVAAGYKVGGVAVFGKKVLFSVAK